MINRKLLVQIYQRNKSQSQTARIFGASRERIRQLLNQEGVNLGAWKSEFYKGKICNGWCKRIIGAEIANNSQGYCAPCWNAKKEGREAFNFRHHNTPANCGICNKDLTPKGSFRTWGLCQACFSRWRYFFEAGFKERVLDRVRRYIARKKLLAINK